MVFARAGVGVEEVAVVAQCYGSCVVAEYLVWYVVGYAGDWYGIGVCF